MSNDNEFHHYNPKLKNFAKQLRKNSTKAEVRMWTEMLKAKKMRGYSFLRQRPILGYIADFYCKELKLVIEIDGFTHDDPVAKKKDHKKDEKLISTGYAVLRFTDYEVMNELTSVKTRLEEWIQKKGIGSLKNIPLIPPSKGDC